MEKLIFLIIDQHIDCGYTLEPLEICILDTQTNTLFFFYVTVGYEGYTVHGHIFLMESEHFVTFEINTLIQFI